MLRASLPARAGPPALPAGRPAPARRPAAPRAAARGQPAPLDRGPVLVVPGFLSDARDYLPLVQELRSRGYFASCAPLRWYNWLPTVGGRSQRPTLDRLDWAVEALARAYVQHAHQRRTGVAAQPPPDVMDLPGPYSPADFVVEMLDASKGACRGLQRVGAVGASGGAGGVRVSLVAHSASGWISRILLGSSEPYGGRTYAAAPRVRALVTLGTPHVSREGVARRNLEFVGRACAGAPEGVALACVAGTGARGRKVGGVVPDLAFQSYELTTGDGAGLGDGITPVAAAHALAGAERVTVEGALHGPKVETGRIWYGSPAAVDAWEPFLGADAARAARTGAGAQPAAE